MTKLDLTGKKALITGASRGIGREIARQFAAAGAQVVVHYHQNRTAAYETLAQLTGEGHFVLQADIAKADEVRRLVDHTVEQLDGLDILVNNAAIYIDHPLTEVDYEAWQHEWQAIIQTNLIGAANLCFCAVPYMKKQGGGKIINVGSRGGYRGEPTAPAYGASKAGLHAMSQSLAKQLGPDKIYVTAVAPGFVETDMATDFLQGPRGDEIRGQSSLNRVATPEEVAHVVLFLAAPGSEWVTGGVIDVNGASYLR
jgi:NAD(P)-dependent dehydrogenase (short-subunit alcohol dehydrogenase family)